MSGKKASATGIEDTSIKGIPGCRARPRPLELDKQHEENDMVTASATVTEDMIPTTRQFQNTEVEIIHIPDAPIARVFVEKDIVQPVALTTAERSLGLA